MANYLFEFAEGDSEGERFFVQTDSVDEAIDAAIELFPFDVLRYCGSYGNFEAEILGYDTY